MPLVATCKKCGVKSVFNRTNKQGLCRNCEQEEKARLEEEIVSLSKQLFEVEQNATERINALTEELNSVDVAFSYSSSTVDDLFTILQEDLDKQPIHEQDLREPKNTKVEQEPSSTEKEKEVQESDSSGSVMSFQQYDLLEHLDILNPESDLFEIMNTSEFKDAQSCLTFALGKDDSGNIVYGDLATMPHLLICGTTGSGKSICINCIILSILFKSSPEEVELMMIDPRLVEMQKFNGIPHMKTNVVTDPKKAPGLLYQAVNTMLERYKVFAKESVRDIDEFNIAKREKGEKIMAKQVIIIDEFADLMLANAKEIEDSICRIAQLGRASGIHLVIATSTLHSIVFTDLIKANIPSRIAFAVASPLNSRMVLGIAGAEELLGKGDMLYMPVGQNKPLRVQGCFVSDAENTRVISFLKDAGLESNYDETLTKEIEENTSVPTGNSGGGSNGEMGSDDLIPKAIELALEYEQISTSMLQRRLRVGYARAARLVDELEMMEIVSPADGNKPRDVLITWSDYRERFSEE